MRAASRLGLGSGDGTPDDGATAAGPQAIPATATTKTAAAAMANLSMLFTG
jgi:hypothetical protein